MVLAGLIPGAAAAVGSQRADVSLRYACQFPSGAEQVAVRVQGTFPGSVEPRSQIRVQGVSVTTTLPEKAVAGLGEGATSVEGVAGLDVLVTEGRRPGSATWQGLTIPGTKVPGQGSLSLEAAGAVPPATIGTEGDAVFSAGALSLRLTLKGAGDGAAAPAPLTVACTPNLGQDSTLVTVPVTGSPDAADPAPSASPGSGGAPSRTRAAPGEECPDPMPEGGYNEKFVHLFPPVPPDHVHVSDPIAGCAFLSGKSNVNKLKGASPIAGRASVIVGQDLYNYPDPPTGEQLTQARHIAVAHLDTLESTFLTFGFMPTTAKMEITQIGNMNLASVGPATVSTRPTITNTWAEATIRVHDVRVNGSPMDVGPNCRTEKPVYLPLTGRSDSDPPYDVAQGGRLVGSIDIPGFSGCGVGEDLDRLLTASISGKGNYIQLTQGPVCFPALGSTRINPCPPTPGYGYSIKPGGEWTATSGPVSIQAGRTGNAVVQCSSTTIRGRFESGTLIRPDAMGEVTGVTFRGCEGNATFGGEDFTVEVGRLPAKITDNRAGIDPATGDFTGAFADWSFQVSSASCSFEISASNQALPAFTHSRSKNEISVPGLGSGMQVRNKSATCARFAGPPQFVEPIVYPGIQQDIRYGQTFE
ncbi:DUF6801 domain-containing protein [Actinomadura rugatobispora]|uniref:DUF6801 domain-containing protein n=1 Tax=Actinomadura rugatobispora TaxID=1994 RepID=A0ABW1A530_9ACTN